MTEPTSPLSLRRSECRRDEPATSQDKTWLRSREGRRYGIEIGLIIAVKLAALALLFLVLAALWPGPSRAPEAVVQQYYTPSAPAVRHD